MASGLAYLHSHGMLHGNVHSRNVHVARGERLKLGDFVGVITPPPPPSLLAACSGEDGYIGEDGAGTRLTPWGLCPDSCRGDGRYTEAADVWALGGVVFEVVHLVRTGLYPPAGRGVCPAVVEMLRCGEEAYSPTARPEGYSDALMSAMESMLQHDPAARPTAAYLSHFSSRSSSSGEATGIPHSGGMNLATQTFPRDALHLPRSCGGEHDHNPSPPPPARPSRPSTPTASTGANSSNNTAFVCVERLRIFLEDRLGLEGFREAHLVVSAVNDGTDETTVVDELERILPHSTLNLYLPALLHLVLRERDSFTNATPAHAAGPPTRICS
jgi:serine/threonine protein kinase